MRTLSRLKCIPDLRVGWPQGHQTMRVGSAEGSARGPHNSLSASKMRVCAPCTLCAPQQWIIKAACGANKSRAMLRASYARANSKKQTHVKNTHFLSRTDKQRLWSDCWDIHTMSFPPINILVSVNKSVCECDLPVCFLFVERAEHLLAKRPCLARGWADYLQRGKLFSKRSSKYWKLPTLHARPDATRSIYFLYIPGAPEVKNLSLRHSAG